MLLPTVNIGSANDVGSAQLKPIPASHDTSTMRVPGENAARSPAATNISGALGSWSTQLTTMSNPARYAAIGTGAVSPRTWHRAGLAGSCLNWTMRAEGIGAATAVTSRWVRIWM